jgi:hypothetical protein
MKSLALDSGAPVPLARQRQRLGLSIADRSCCARFGGPSPEEKWLPILTKAKLNAEVMRLRNADPAFKAEMRRERRRGSEVSPVTARFKLPKHREIMPVATWWGYKPPSPWPKWMEGISDEDIHQDSPTDQLTKNRERRLVETWWRADFWERPRAFYRKSRQHPECRVLDPVSLEARNVIAARAPRKILRTKIGFNPTHRLVFDAIVDGRRMYRLVPCAPPFIPHQAIDAENVFDRAEATPRQPVGIELASRSAIEENAARAAQRLQDLRV